MLMMCGGREERRVVAICVQRKYAVHSFICSPGIGWLWMTFKVLYFKYLISIYSCNEMRV